MGVCVAANKIPGIRAGMCHDTYSAHQGVEHDDMNVIVLGARIVGPSLAYELVDAFINGKVHFQRRTVYAAIQESAGDRSEVSMRPGSTSRAVSLQCHLSGRAALTLTAVNCSLIN